MRDRAVPSAPARSPTGSSPYTVDVILFTPRGKQLAVLAVRAADPRARERWALPFDAVDAEESLDGAARRIARSACGADVTWMEQVGAFADGKRHPSGEPLSIAFVAVIPANVASTATSEAAWFGVTEPPALTPRQRAMFDAAIELMRTRMDYAPIAFRLLPPMFTLSELQQMYELLLGKRLHKASFRRALQAAYLVEPTDEWRSEGRGRPAQFFRHAPRKRRGNRRGVRFDVLG